MPTESPARWSFFGAPKFHQTNGKLVSGVGKKPAALLALAAHSSEGVSRRVAAEMLWPDASPPRALHSLRQALLSLRKSFGESFDDMVEASADQIKIQKGAVDIDVEQFLDFAESANPKHWEEAAALYSDDYLTAFQGVSDPFDKWAHARRDTLAAKAELLFERLAAAAEGRGDDKNATRYRSLAERIASRPDLVMSAENTAPETGSPEFRGADASRRNRLVGAVAAFAVIVGAVLLILREADSLPDSIDLGLGVFEPSETPSIAVMPFSWRGEGAISKELADGLTQGVTYALYAVTAQELFVVTDLSTVVGDSAADRTKIARRLGVRYLMLGSVEVTDSRMRLEARLLDTRTLEYVWTDQFDRSVGEIFALQDELTLAIISGLDIDLSSAERNRISLIDDTDSLKAWLAAGNGLRLLIKVSRLDNIKAQEFYREALAHDPEYVSAWRGLAWTHFLDARLGWSESPQASIGKAVQLSQQVLARSPEDGTTHSLVGAVKLLQNDYDAAVMHGEKAVALLPNAADTTAVLAHTLTYVGESERALTLLDRAMALSPNHPDWYDWAKGRALRLAGRAAESVQILEDRTRGRPPSVAQLVELTASYAAANEMENARRTAEQIQKFVPHFSVTKWLENPRLQDPEEHQREFGYLVASGLPE